jgi:eukaryotic-like serine/threonine-protein kinase
LESCREYETGLIGALWPAYLRGLAYLKQGSPVEGGVEFRKVPDHRGITSTEAYYPLAYLAIARAAAMKAENAGKNGDATTHESELAQARKAYQDFFALWKDADKNILVLREAQQEYEKLK